MRQTAFEYDYLNAPQAGASTSPSDQPAAPVQQPVEQAVPAAAACQSGCESGCTGGCKERPCRLCMDGKLADPWTLPQPEALKDRNITVGGWLEGGIYGNQYGAPSNGPIGLRNVGDGFTADQLWIFGERKTDTKGCGWDIGGRIDYLFGADGPDTQAFGDRTWDYGWNTLDDYGSAIPQTVRGDRLQRRDGQGGPVLHADRLRSRASHAELLLLALVLAYTSASRSPTPASWPAYKRNDKVTFYGGWVNGWDEGFEGKDDGSHVPRRRRPDAVRKGHAWPGT